MVHEINVGVYRLEPSRICAGTSGSYGVEKIRFIFGEEWSGLVKTVTFYPKMGKPVSVLLTADETDIPHEATAKTGNVRFAVEGSSSGKVIRSLPGQMAVMETVRGSGAPGQTPTPTETEQIKEYARSAADSAAEAASGMAQIKSDIAAGKIKGDKGDKGEKGDKGDTGAKGDRGDTGAQGVSGVYVGSGDMPAGYNVQIDIDGNAPLYNPVSKTASMTQSVGVDGEGRLYTAPGGGGSAAVDTEMSDTSENPVMNKTIKAYVDGAVPTDAINANTAARHTHSNKALLDSYTQTEANLAGAVSSRHTHSNKALLDSYSQTNANLSDAVTKKHSHDNKQLLDSYNQTNVNLSDAVTKRHSHDNKTALDTITAAKITSWDGKVDASQGVANAGKVLVVGTDGSVAPGDAGGSSYISAMTNKVCSVPWQAGTAGLEIDLTKNLHVAVSSVSSAEVAWYIRPGSLDGAYVTTGTMSSGTVIIKMLGEHHYGDGNNYYQIWEIADGSGTRTYRMNKAYGISKFYLTFGNDEASNVTVNLYEG